MFQVFIEYVSGWQLQCTTDDADYALEVANMLLTDGHQIKLSSYPKA